MAGVVAAASSLQAAAAGGESARAVPVTLASFSPVGRFGQGAGLAPADCIIPVCITSVCRHVLHAASGALLSCLDPAVLSATVGASFKLFLICAATGWLLRHGKIPAATATVLSQARCTVSSAVSSALTGKIYTCTGPPAEPPLLLVFGASSSPEERLRPGEPNSPG